MALIKAASRNTYNCHVTSAFDYSIVVSGETAHGGAALYDHKSDPDTKVIPNI